MSALTIAPLGQTDRAEYWSTLASLPLSFASSRDGEPTDVVSVGGDADWVETATAAIEDGVGAIVVSRPRPVESSRVRELVDLAESHSVAVEFADEYAGDPVFEKHGAELGAHLQAVSALIITQIESEVAGNEAAFSVLRTVRALGLTANLRSIVDRGTSVTVVGTAGTLALEGTVTRGSAGIGQRIQALGYAKNIDIRLNGSSTARPASAMVTSMAGETKLSTVYETAERAAWRRISANRSATANRTTALRAFLSDLETLEQV